MVQLDAVAFIAIIAKLTHATLLISTNDDCCNHILSDMSHGPVHNTPIVGHQYCISYHR